MPLIQDSAVVLGRLDYSETSQILVLFTSRHGKVRAIAKGAKRSTKTRFAPGVDLLDLGSVVLSVRHERAEGLATLTEWKQSRSFSGLREKLERIHAAQYCAEITARLTEDWDPHPELYDGLVSALQELSDPTNVLGTVVRFQWVALEQVGSNPRVDECVACGRDSQLTHFSAFEGGLICRNCEVGRVEKWEVALDTIEELRGLAAGVTNIGQRIASMEGAFSVLNYHISHLIGMEPLVADLIIPSQKRRRH